MDGAENVPIGTTTDSIYEHIGRRIKIRRKQVRLTHQDLADAVGVTKQMVTKYESACHAVSVARLWQISQALNVKLSWFFDGFGDEKVSGPDFSKYLKAPGAAEVLETYALASYSHRSVIRQLVGGFKKNSEVHNATEEGRDNPG